MEEPGRSGGRKRRDWDSWLDALGLTTPFRRDSALATLVATATAGPLLLPGVAGTVGLIGMRERAGLIGASPAASPTPDGRRPVKLTIPRTAGRPS